MQLPFEIVCIDIETTDPDSILGNVIQIGAVLMSKEFKIIDSFNIFIQPLTTHRNQKAMAVNKISEDTLATADTLQNALELFENFCKDTKMLGAWGSYFDVAFLKEQYKKIYKDWPFGYRSIDLKSIAIWEFAKIDAPLSGGVFKACERLAIPFEGTAHDGLDDIKNTIKILQKLLSYEYSPYAKGWGKK
jgi:DNA polymerase III alpha subunit (gram-positive type)